MSIRQPHLEPITRERQGRAWVELVRLVPDKTLAEMSVYLPLTKNQLASLSYGRAGRTTVEAAEKWLSEQDGKPVVDKPSPDNLRQRVVNMAAEGKNSRYISFHLNITPRQVREILAKSKKDARWPSLEERQRRVVDTFEVMQALRAI